MKKMKYRDKTFFMVYKLNRILAARCSNKTKSHHQAFTNFKAFRMECLLSNHMDSVVRIVC